MQTNQLEAGMQLSALPDPTAAGVGAAVLLMQFIILRRKLGMDPDGSGTIGEFLGILGGFDQLSRVIRAPGMAWDAGAAEARTLVRAKVLRAEPLMTRLALPDA